jgi:hypothetical protein
MTREEITAMLDGLDGVTPGPWIPWRSLVTRPDNDNTLAMCYPDVVEDDDPAGTLAKHLSRCDPATIRALCTLALRGLQADRLAETNSGDYLVGTISQHEVAELRAENERLLRERDGARARAAENWDLVLRSNEGVLDVESRARAKAIDEAAQLVGQYHYALAKRILALKDKPADPVI